MVKLVKIVPSAKADKKYDAHFITDANREKVVSFGAKGMEDFTTHKDEERRQRYIARHKANEDWSSPMTAGALSYFVLWSSKTLRGGIANYKRRFNL
jgi:2,3-bisphosphoglycerate-independent phosphoglycerate mutase